MWIVHNMRWIMLVSGVLTATMVQAAITPDSALQSNFGETVSGPLAHLVVRNWGALIALVGGMLIYGAFNPLHRSLVLVVAGVSKVIFIALVLSEGARYLSHQAGVAVTIDSVMVVLFAWYWWPRGPRQSPHAYRCRPMPVSECRGVDWRELDDPKVG